MSRGGNNGDGQTSGPQLDPLDEHIISMLKEEQWTTGAIIDSADQRLRAGELEIEGIDVPDQVDSQRKESDLSEDSESSEDGEISENIEVDERLIKPQDVYDSLRAFKKLGAIEYAHQPTSLYRLVFDPRIAAECDQHAN